MCQLALVSAAWSLLLSAAFTNGLKLEIDAFKNRNFAPGRDVIVRLSEWKWKDIADECERFLGPKGFGGVQTSPVTENLIVERRPTIERYQPMSYRLITRSGNAREFEDMVKRCNKVGVRIYVDLVLNHMTKNVKHAFGTGNATAEPFNRRYPAVPYNTRHFHPHCRIQNFSDVNQVRNCYLFGHDLDHSNQYVIWKTVRLMNDLVALGVAGFRIDSATFMWPEELNDIYSRVNALPTEHGFPNNSRPFIYQSVISAAMFGSISIKALKEFRNTSNFLPSNDAIVFIDHHEVRMMTNATLTYKSDKLSKVANAFMLAHTYGTPIVMSSYVFDNVTQGPPADEYENIVSPMIKDDGSCDGGWICEHRWRQISNMIAFRKAVSGTAVHSWWCKTNYQQLAFSRGDQGLLVINIDQRNLNTFFRTPLPEGHYCDVISGDFVDGECSGKIIHVNKEGFARFLIGSDDENGVIAIHRNAKLSNPPKQDE